MKRCARCGETKDESSFYRHKGNKDGRAYQCKACQNASAKRYRDGNVEYHAKDVARASAYLKAHPEVRLRAQARYRANPKNKPTMLAWQREYTKRNLEKKAAQARAWRKRKPASAAAQRHKRRALRTNAPGCASAEQIASRLAVWGYKCWLCAAPYAALDHVKPLVRGGSNWPANLRPICRSCNSSKGSQWAGVSWVANIRRKQISC